MQKFLKQTDLLLGVGLLVVVSMLILPLPTIILDIGLVAAIASSVIILLASVNISDPLQFSVFPSMLLITTLFRLSLSLAATKLILGSGNAGHVIQTFGDFVMGGDFVVGFVAFLILMIVQFIVITNGAGRVAEVVARFTLDAMPGKQMAIDADLAAGLIDETEAKDRRKRIKQEADFYGSMDGASKFVKGDAIAALLIIAVNIVGGFVVGFMRGDGDAMSILRTYCLLSVGEGLCSQLPALLISTAAGLMVTRAGQDRSMGPEVASQLTNQPKAIGVAGGALALFAFVPGFPATIFLTAAVLCGLAYQALTKLKEKEAMEAKLKPKQAAPNANLPTGPEAVLPLLNMDPIEIEIGYGLAKLADKRLGGDLSERVASTRKQIALELGFVMPTVRIRDSVHLKQTEYVIKIRGEEIARAEARPDQLLAVNSGAVLYAITGLPTRDPVFGLEAYWIDKPMKEIAEKANYTVIEPSAMISTHLSEIVKTHASELLSREDVNKMLENTKSVNKTVVEELIPGILQTGDVQKVLQHLLREKVPIRDFVTILETMADYGARIKDTDQLGELVRASIARSITRQFLEGNKLYCITVDPMLERTLTDNIQQTGAGAMLSLDLNTQRQLLERVQRSVDRCTGMGHQPVLLCTTTLRLPLRRLLEKYQPNLHVLSYAEVAPQADVEFVDQLQAA